MISVIVPVYNVEKYLERCVKSIVAQTYTDLEILLIDDGSTDKSGKMCDDFQQTDSRIKAFHKQNGGLSDTRNYGIEHSAGEFISFVDSDDYIDEKMLETLHRLITENDADLAVCSAMDVFEGKEVTQVKEIKEFNLNKVESYKYMLRGDGIPSACNKLYKRQTVGDVRFPVGKLYEDGFFTPQILKKVEKTAVTSKPMYYYFRRADSITTKPFRKGDLDVIEAYDKCVKQVKELCPEALPYAEFRYRNAYFNVLDKMLMRDDCKEIPEYKQVVKYLKKHTAQIVKDPGFGKMRKIAAVALKFSVPLYKKILLTKQKIYKIQ